MNRCRRVLRLVPPVAFCLAILLLVGCVDRRFVVVSDVPAAQIFWDGKPLGPAPVDSRWEYAGEYTLTALAPGYEPYKERVRLRPKWYMYPPFDIVAELLYPGRIEDVRTIEIKMKPKVPLSDTELVNLAEGLRQDGKSLPAPKVPNNANDRNNQAPASPAPPRLDVGSTPGTIPGAASPYPSPDTAPPGTPALPPIYPPGYETPIGPIPIGPNR